jgi:hypothetical protein
MSSRADTNRLAACLSLLAALLALNACGGGGGESTAASTAAQTASSSSPPSSPSPTPTTVTVTAPALDYTYVATESAPRGPTIDLKAANLMPVSPDQARWEYAITDIDGNYISMGARQLVKPYDDLNGPVADLVENEGTVYDSAKLVAREDGIYIDYSANRTYPPQAARQIGQVRAFAYATYAAGEPRIVVRQGVWDEDVDNDGKYEVFRFEFVQTLREFGTLNLPLVTAGVARFSNVRRFSLTRSKTGETDGMVVREDAYLARGAGALRLVRRTEKLDGTVIKDIRIWTVTRLPAHIVSEATAGTPSPSAPAAN